jgi:hypothetical protein
MPNTAAGKLTDQQWSWIIGAALFAWIKTRYQQAIAEGLPQEEHVTRMDPSPRNAALALAILPTLADQCSIDWARPLADWSREEMAGFVALASGLIDEARAVLAQNGGGILRKPERAELDDDIPF